MVNAEIDKAETDSANHDHYPQLSIIGALAIDESEILDDQIILSGRIMPLIEEKNISPSSDIPPIDDPISAIKQAVLSAGADIASPQSKEDFDENDNHLTASFAAKLATLIDVEIENRLSARQGDTQPATDQKTSQS